MFFFALMLKVHGRQLDKPDLCCVQGGLVVVGNSCAQNVNVFLYFYSTIEAAVYQVCRGVHNHTIAQSDQNEE